MMKAYAILEKKFGIFVRSSDVLEVYAFEMEWTNLCNIGGYLAPGLTLAN